MTALKFRKIYNTTGFTFEDLSGNLLEQYIYSVIFIITYIIIICGNYVIIVVIWQDSHLHSPMYIFLLNLAILDIASSSNILPKFITMTMTQSYTILFWECMMQLYLFIALVGTEVLLLAIMAYDRYLAICHPLHYISLMSLKHTAGLSVSAWTAGFLSPIGYVTLMSRLSYCASHLISHFFCDVSPLLRISCSDISQVEILNYAMGTLYGLFTFVLILVSYFFIITTILHIKSVEGRAKAFSTCSSHLTCVVIFYATLICLHMRPTSSYSSKIDKRFAVVYTALVPMLNPFIYSLKNADFKQAVWKLKKNFGDQIMF